MALEELFIWPIKPSLNTKDEYKSFDHKDLILFAMSKLLFYEKFYRPHNDYYDHAVLIALKLFSLKNPSQTLVTQRLVNMSQLLNTKSKKIFWNGFLIL